MNISSILDYQIKFMGIYHQCEVHHKDHCLVSQGLTVVPTVLSTSLYTHDVEPFMHKISAKNCDIFSYPSV